MNSPPRRDAPPVRAGSRPSSRLTPRLTVAVWVVTRAAALVLLFVVDPWVADDLRYYAGSLTQASGEGGWWSGLVEYPVPGVAFLAVPWGVLQAAGSLAAYAGVAAALLLLLDAWLTTLLARPDRTDRAALAVWLWGAPLVGATTYARFDLLPGVLAAVAILLVASRPRWAAACLALATAVKLWPVLLLPLLVAAVRRRAEAAAVVVLVGVAAAGSTLALGGWDRLLSPLTWQTDRGLHLESVAASPVVAVWAVDPHAYVVAKSPYNAWEISGPGTAALEVATTVSAVVALVVVAALSVRVWRRRRDGDTPGDLLGWPAVAAVLLLLVSGKVFSPQYVLWLLPVAAAALAVRSRPGRRALDRWWVGALLLLAACTQLVFPLLYGVLVRHEPGVEAAVAFLVLRNLLVVVLAGVAVVAAWRVTGRSEAPVPHPSPDGTMGAAAPTPHPHPPS